MLLTNFFWLWALFQRIKRHCIPIFGSFPTFKFLPRRSELWEGFRTCTSRRCFFLLAASAITCFWRPTALWTLPPVEISFFAQGVTGFSRIWDRCTYAAGRLLVYFPYLAGPLSAPHWRTQPLAIQRYSQTSKYLPPLLLVSSESYLPSRNQIAVPPFSVWVGLWINRQNWR